MGQILDAAGRTGALELMVLGGIAFYVASRVVRSGDWGDGTANSVRNAIAWALWLFGVAVLIAAVVNIPGCKRHQPQIQQQHVEPAPAEPPGQRQVPGNQQ